jgi:hypothetical protein
MKNLYHDDFGTHDLVQELRIAKERRFFRLEQGTPEGGKEMATGWKNEGQLLMHLVECLEARQEDLSMNNILSRRAQAAAGVGFLARIGTDSRPPDMTAALPTRT